MSYPTATSLRHRESRSTIRGYRVGLFGALAGAAALSLGAMAVGELGGVEDLTVGAPDKGAAGAIPSPLRPSAAQESDLFTALEVDSDAIRAIDFSAPVTLTGFVLGHEQTVDLELEQFEVLAPDATIVVGGANGEREMKRPDVTLLRGRVSGEANSFVFLSLSPHGVSGLIELGSGTRVISSGPFGEAHAEAMTAAVANLTTLPPGAIEWREFECVVLEAPGDRPAQPVQSAAARGAQPPCRVADIAVDTDWAFTGSLFNWDTDASAAYAITLMGAISAIYERDVNTRLNVPFLRLWEDNTGPYSSGDAFDILNEFRDLWNNSMGHVSRHAAHLLVGRAISGAGGVAYLGGLCHSSFGYGLSAHLNGFFPIPVQDNHFQNWDLLVVAHEIGHNFGAPHTHGMNPQIDNCAGGDCSVTPNGTLMGYCHGCPGGMNNVLMSFHERMVDEAILPFLNSASCNLTGNQTTIVSQPDDVETSAGGAAMFSVGASGADPLVYQWRRDGVELADNARISGAQSPELTIDPVEESDAGFYDVIVGWTAGSCDVSSEPALLTIAAPCVGDLAGDGQVGSADLAILLGLWGEDAPFADFDGDGFVGSGDLAILLGSWGPCL